MTDLLGRVQAIVTLAAWNRGGEGITAQDAAEAILANLDPRSLLSEAERQALADGEAAQGIPEHALLSWHEHDGQRWWEIEGDFDETCVPDWRVQGPTIAAAARAARERLEAEHGT